MSNVPGFSVNRDPSIRLGEAFSLSPDFFSKAQLQWDLREASYRKRRKIKPLAAQDLSDSSQQKAWIGHPKTLLVMNGTSIQLMANQLEHSGTRIAEKHYDHYSPS